MKLAGKQVTVTYRDNYPDKNCGFIIKKKNGEEVKAKKNMVLEKGDLIIVSVMAPGWLKSVGYAIKVK